MTKNEREIERLTIEAREKGTSYGRYVATLPKKVKVKKVKKRSEPVIVPISAPVEKKRLKSLKSGWTQEMVESWREIRRMFGKE